MCTNSTHLRSFYEARDNWDTFFVSFVSFILCAHHFSCAFFLQKSNKMKRKRWEQMNEKNNKVKEWIFFVLFCFCVLTLPTKESANIFLKKYFHSYNILFILFFFYFFFAFQFFFSTFNVFNFFFVLTNNLFILVYFFFACFAEPSQHIKIAMAECVHIWTKKITTTNKKIPREIKLLHIAEAWNWIAFSMNCWISWVCVMFSFTTHAIRHLRDLQDVLVVVVPFRMI